MRKIDKPQELPGEVFLACISHIRDLDLKRRLESCENTIIGASQELETKAVNLNLHEIYPSDDVSGFVTKDEMLKVYTDRMVPKDAPGRDFYDRLISRAPYGRCPLCGHGMVSTLDHYFPKAHYPTLAVVPLNLVPCCGDCNKKKSDKILIEEKEAFLHPYFDDIDDEYWLKSRVIELNQPVIEFYIDPPSSWSDLLIERVKNQFYSLELDILYSSQAAQELRELRERLRGIFGLQGSVGVGEFLREEALSRAAYLKNSWKVAMLMGLADSVWYCDGGFYWPV